MIRGLGLGFNLHLISFMVRKGYFDDEFLKNVRNLN